MIPLHRDARERNPNAFGERNGELMYIGRTRERMAGRVCLVGNIDAAAYFIGCIEEVEDVIKQDIDAAGLGGGYILASF